jgi:hypothetical protein
MRSTPNAGFSLLGCHQPPAATLRATAAWGLPRLTSCFQSPAKVSSTIAGLGRS